MSNKTYFVMGLLVCGGFTLLSPTASRAQAPNSSGGLQTEAYVRPPVTEADLRIVARAREILNSPSKWNRADNRECPPSARTVSLYCALEKATDEVAHAFEHRGAAMQEARFVIEDVSVKGREYDHRLMDYNNDPSTTFADIQKVLRFLQIRLEERLREEPALLRSGAVTSVTSPDPRPQDASVTATDLEVLRRARDLLSSPDRWNRADTQNCPTDAPTISLFCALNRAAIEITGRFDNQGAAIQEARAVISESAPNRAKYQSRLMDFNNDPETLYVGIQKLFATVEERLMRRLAPANSK
jgi:hypothetical protein